MGILALGALGLIPYFELVADPVTIIDSNFSQHVSINGVLVEHPPFLFRGSNTDQTDGVTAIFGSNWTMFVQAEDGLPLNSTTTITSSTLTNSREFLVQWPRIVADDRQIKWQYNEWSPTFNNEFDTFVNYPSFPGSIISWNTLELPSLPLSERDDAWSGHFWRRTYHAGLSATTVTHPIEGKDYMILAMTGENRNYMHKKNSSSWRKRYQNNVLLDNPIGSNGIPTTANLLFADNTYLDGSGNPVPSALIDELGDSFHTTSFGFVSIAILPWGSLGESGYDWGDGTFVTRGPVAWPARGYTKLQDGHNIRASNGVYHPHIIRANTGNGDYVYIFYTDDGGRGLGPDGPADWLSNNYYGFGTRVIRAPASSAYDARTYKLWSNGWTNTNSLPWTLPQTVNALRYNESRYRLQNPNRRIVDPYEQYEDGTVQCIGSPVRVAKLSGTNKWLMLEHVNWGPSGNFFRIALRLSSDLVNWSNPVFIDQLDAPVNDDGWGFSFYYAGFANAEGNDSNEIDPTGFWIVGRDTLNGGYSKLFVSIDVNNFTQADIWDGLSQDNNGWRNSPWYGWVQNLSKVNPNDAGWYYHLIHGLQIHVGSTQDEFLVYDQALMRYYFVRQSSYP